MEAASCTTKKLIKRDFLRDFGVPMPRGSVSSINIIKMDDNFVMVSVLHLAVCFFNFNLFG